ncbi:family 12 glycoside hydrolase [Stagonosporopsis vannaccii]|nr:family 12 glycoside hydrolase [Stagonosporopsis vannaccii]
MSSNVEASVATRIFHATCHCRASTLSFTVPTSSLPLAVHFCHCSICRRSTGALCTAGTIIPEPAVNLSTLTAYKSSEYLTRWFCSTCGAHLLGTIQLGNLKKWFVSAPSVDAEEGVWDFAGHVFVGSTGDGGLATLLRSIGGKELGLWEAWSGKSAAWHASERTERINVVAHTENDRLHARCHCGGIEFYVSRPTGHETFTEVDENYVRKDRDKWLAVHDVCNTCRLAISTWVISWFFPSRNHITLKDGSPYPADGIFGTAKAYSSSPGVDRTFCGKCGAAASYVCDDRPQIVDVPVGLLDGDDVRAEDWLEWRTYKLAWEDDAVWKSVREALKKGLQAPLSKAPSCRQLVSVRYHYIRFIHSFTLPFVTMLAQALLSLALVAPTLALPAPQPMVISDTTKQKATSLCGISDSVVLTDTPWIVFNMMYNQALTVGTQCTNYDHVATGADGNKKITWSAVSNIDYVKSTDNIPKGYSFIGLTQNLETKLSAIKSIPTTYDWTRTNTTAYKGNICFDFMTSDTKGDSTSSAAQELMLWLEYTGGQLPIGWPAGPKATINDLYGTSWKLYQGKNEDTGITVSSLLPDKQFSGKFSGDIKEWLEALVKVGVFKESTYVNVGNAGTEPFYGKAVVNATLGLQINL